MKLQKIKFIRLAWRWTVRLSSNGSANCFTHKIIPISIIAIAKTANKTITTTSKHQ